LKAEVFIGLVLIGIGLISGIVPSFNTESETLQYIFFISGSLLIVSGITWIVTRPNDESQQFNSSVMQK
jgi:hypothetical protein